MFGAITINPLRDRIRDASTPSSNWGTHANKLAFVGLGLIVVAVFAYTWFRDWRMQRRFRKFWKSKAYAGEGGPTPLVTAAPRQTLIKQNRTKRRVEANAVPAGTNWHGQDADDKVRVPQTASLEETVPVNGKES